MRDNLEFNKDYRDDRAMGETRKIGRVRAFTSVMSEGWQPTLRFLLKPVRRRDISRSGAWTYIECRLRGGPTRPRRP